MVPLDLHEDIKYTYMAFQIEKAGIRLVRTNGVFEVFSVLSNV